MIINFSDDYVDAVNLGLTMIGNIQCRIAKYEPTMGNAPQLDKLYSLSILIHGIVDQLSYDDNSDPAQNEALLRCLKTLNNTGICGPACEPVLDMRNYHNLSPYPVAEEIFTQH